MMQPHAGPIRRSGHPLPAALATALLLVLAMPDPAGWWPLLFIALVPLLHSAMYQRPGRSAMLGLVTGLIYHLGMMYWIVIVLGRYGGLPLWISVPALLLLSLYMSLYMALFAGLFSFLAGRYRSGQGPVSAMIFVAPILWVGLDWLRGHLLTGFPWMDLGYGLYSRPVLIQVADLGGHGLVTFCLVLVNVLALWAIEYSSHHAPLRLSHTSRRLAAASCCFLVLAGGYSILRYRHISALAAAAPQTRVTVVQGSIPQDEKWTPGREKSTTTRYDRLSALAIAGKRPDLVVWPETALPFFPQQDTLFYRVTELAARNKIWLLTGAPFFTIKNRRPGAGRTVSYFNSALLINPSGRLAGRYDKQHLVPFGEYVPWRKYLPFLKPLVKNVGDFTPGHSFLPLPAGPLKLGVLICFESIFPDLARQEAAAGANLLVNLTNDAWYGNSSAPHQSFAMTVFRAVETRRSLVRAANTGVSGFVSPSGRILDQSPLFQPLTITANVPLLEEKTIFVRFGYRFGPACLVLIPLLFFFRRRRNRFLKTVGMNLNP
ncbi:apolipoprotein N-acyltransferase [bacterium BMS3Abin13]|nr:apolipoprotein N-acyltransferase [bacterium BMS3Abin13]